MGLFSSTRDSKTVTDQTQTMYNQTLGGYTQPYRAASPWTFASLDPTATLFAMGEGSKLGDTQMGADFKAHLQGLSADEKKGAEASQEALTRIRQRQESGQFLTSQETNFINQSLDKAFEYAHKTGYQDWEKATQMMAGGRGLRMSDTPVAEPSLRELRNFEVGLGSARAKAGLDTTMQFSAQQQLFDEGLREFQESLMQNKWQSQQGFLFGGGMQGAGNVGSTTRLQGTTSTNETTTPSLMSQISQGMGMAGNVAGMAVMI